MNKVELNGTNYGLQPKSYISQPQFGNVFQTYPSGVNPLVRNPKQDIFAPQTQPIQPQKPAALPVQDVILASFFPEKLVVKYTNKDFLNKVVQQNPNITKLLNSEGVDTSIEPQNVQTIAQSHLIPTKDIALKILKQVKPNHTAQEAQNLAAAALLHDIGKAFIPASILNKQEKLTEKEQNIIKLHNELSYEILKTNNLPPQVLEMVQNHHNYKGIGTISELTQILKVADIYSALREERSYKKTQTNDEAFRILYEDASNGEFDSKYVTALKDSIEQTALV